MLSKWEWIRDKCCENGAKSAAYLADEIMQLLAEIYGELEVSWWIRYYECVESKYRSLDNRVARLSYVIAVAELRNLCVACIIDKKCSKCRFGKIAGKCDSSGSLYESFVYEVRMTAAVNMEGEL